MNQKDEIELNRLIRLHNEDVKKKGDGWLVVRIPLKTWDRL